MVPEVTNICIGQTDVPTHEADHELDKEIQQRLPGLKQMITANLQRGHFTQSPDEPFHDPTLSCSAKLVYRELLSFMRDKGYCWPSQETLSRAIGTMSKRTVSRALKELQTRRYVGVWRRGQGRTNVYYILSLAELAASQGVPDKASQQTSREAMPVPLQCHNERSAGSLCRAPPEIGRAHV